MDENKIETKVRSEPDKPKQEKTEEQRQRQMPYLRKAPLIDNSPLSTSRTTDILKLIG